MSCPVGFKNGTDGNVKIAVDAVQAAAHPHHFLAVTKQGRSAIATTAGNDDCHIILRGGKAPNYDAASIASVCAAIAGAGLRPHVMIDVSHGNSGKRPENQPRVVDDIAQQIEGGARASPASWSKVTWSAGARTSPGPAAGLRTEHYRRLHRLGDVVLLLERLARAVDVGRRRAK